MREVNVQQWIELANGDILAIPEDAYIQKTEEKDGTIDVSLYTDDKWNLFREKDSIRAKSLWTTLRAQLREGRKLISLP